MSDTQGTADTSPYVPPLPTGGPRNTVCTPWATAADVVAVDESYAELDPYRLAEYLLPASSMLWRKTGKRYPGICQDYVRPCGRSYSTLNAPVWHGAAMSSLYGSTWRWFSSWGTCGCGQPTTRTCGCDGPGQITLGRSPIAEILEVTIDGDVLLDGVDYRVDDFRWLVRLPDEDGRPRSWPCCQRLDLPPTEDDTFGVLFSYGRMPPPELVVAAAVVAGELTKGADGGDCDLPAEVVRASRQNLDFAVVTPSSDAWANMPLIVRMAIESVNPNGLTRAPKVWTPDLDPGPAIRPDTA